MTDGPLAPVLHHIQQLTGLDEARQRADGELLARFAACPEETAFAALVERHGPMVLGVCRRLLHDRHEAEDVFQAVFLVLARKASGIRRGEALAGWLHQVAWRIARDARKRRRCVGGVPDVADARQEEPAEAAGRKEVGRVLEEEVGRLPDKYRLPLVLCYFQGRTHEQAAQELRWPCGTVAGRLSRARAYLQQRLSRRGLAMPVVGAALAEGVPAVLAETTLRVAVLFVTGSREAPVGALVERGLRALAVGKAKLLWGLALVLGLTALGTGVLAHQKLASQGRKPPDSDAPESEGFRPRLAWPRVDQQGDPLPPGAVARLGTVRWRPGAMRLAYSADGKKVAMQPPSGGSPQVCEAATGREICRLAGAAGMAAHLAFTPDGRFLVTADFEDRLTLWDATTGKAVRPLGKPFRIRALALSPDGKYAATAGGSRVELWELATGHKGPELASRDAVYNCLTFASDSKTLAAAGVLGDIKVWDVTTGALARELVGHKEAVQALAFLPDSRSLLSGAAGEQLPPGEPFPLRLWDVKTGKDLKRFPRQRHGVAALALLPGGTTFVSAGSDQVMRTWDVRSGKQLRTLSLAGIHGGVGPLTLTPDGKEVIALGRPLRFHDALTGRERPRYPTSPGWPAVEAAFVGHKTVVSHHADGSALVWDAATGKLRRRWMPGLPFSGGAVAATADGRTLATAIWKLVGGQKVRLWRLDEEGKEKLLRTWPGVNRPVAAVALSDDGRTLAAASGDRLYLIDTASGKETSWKVGPPSRQDPPLVFAPGGRHLAVCADRRLRLYELGGKEPHLCWEAPDRDYLCVAFSPDGRTLALASEQLLLIERASRKVRGRLKGPPRWAARSVAFTPDGRTLIAGGYSTPDIRFWDTTTFRELGHWDGHIGSEVRVTLSGDGRRLVSAAGDATLLVWDLAARPGKRQEGGPRP